VSTTEAVGAIRRFRRFRVADRVRQFAGVLTLFGVLWLVRALAGIGGFFVVCGVLLAVSLTPVARARATSGDGRCCGKGPSIVLDRRSETGRSDRSESRHLALLTPAVGR